DEGEGSGVARFVARYRFERDRHQIDDDQEHKKSVDQGADAIANRALLEHMIDAPTQILEVVACHVIAPYCASAASIAFSAASAFDPSGPPACAMSGRPPPPFPPSASAPFLTRSTAFNRLVRSSVTPTTMPALPSSAVATMATTPEPTWRLPSSARLRRSLSSMPETARASSLTPFTWRISLASPLARPPPPIASL